MSKIKLAISGCLGRMGQQLIKSTKKNKNFNLVALTESKALLSVSATKLKFLFFFVDLISC